MDCCKNRRFAPDNRSPAESRYQIFSSRRPAGDRPIVTAEVSDGRIEWRKQPLMGRRQNDHSATRSQKPRRVLQLFSVALDVFQNVDVDDAVELLTLDALQGAANDLTTCASVELFDVGCQLLDKSRIGFKAGPASTAPAIKVGSVSPETSADLENIPPKERPYLARPIRFPVVYGCEQV